jgi:hypothetical protein
MPAALASTTEKFFSPSPILPEPAHSSAIAWEEMPSSRANKESRNIFWLFMLILQHFLVAAPGRADLFQFTIFDQSGTGHFLNPLSGAPQGGGVNQGIPVKLDILL